jgi:hypothetical protein
VLQCAVHAAARASLMDTQDYWIQLAGLALAVLLVAFV